MLKLLLAHLASGKNRTSPMHDLLARDAAWLVVGFFGFLRRSELIALRISDVAVTPSHITITIRRSKTDQVGAGAQVCLAHTSGSGIAIAGPIRTLLAILQKQGAHPSSPLFPSWDYHNLCLTHAPLTNGQALAKRLRSFLIELKARFPELRVNPESYGMHSLRRGGVVAAWGAGIDLEKIKAHGRWKSDAVRTYLTASLPIKLSVTSAM
jgi:integrase